ncbi:MAG: winged helix-turn-helix domain-containing protein [Deltaproteobacteria bacterium]|nr:winged helix-turn-helix domain-containing protein [Deltaproteobacteria bacterium]
MVRLDEAQGVLLVGGERVVLVPKAATLLRVLAERGGRVVSREELIAAVWPDVVVEDNNLAKLVFTLRKHLGEEAIETVPRRGYRLVAPVQLGAPPSEVSPAAYDLYLQGRYLWNRRPGDVVWAALECFHKAIEIAPRFAPAWAGIADAYATLGSWEAGALPHSEAHAKAWSYATRALELDPTLVEAITTRAYTTLHYGWDLDAAEQRFRRAIDVAPRYAPALHWYSHCLVAAGRFPESLQLSRDALAQEPMNLLLHVHLAWHHVLAGAAADARAQAERVIAMDPQFHWGHYFAGWAADALGEPARAIDAMREAVRCSHDDRVMRAGLARAYALAGERAAAHAIVAELAPAGLFDYEVALVHLALGDTQAALAALAQARDARSGWFAYARVDPRLATIREHPRFPALAPITLTA